MIGTGTVNASGQASITIASLSVGSHAITAVFNGDGNFLTSTGTLAGGQTVNKSPSATTIVSATNPSVFGQPVLFTATVTAAAPGAGAPTGTVTFFDGATMLGTGTITAGQATFTTGGLSVGNHSVTASYGGDGNFLKVDRSGSRSIPRINHLDKAPQDSVEQS